MTHFGKLIYLASPEKQQKIKKTKSIFAATS